MDIRKFMLAACALLPWYAISTVAQMERTSHMEDPQDSAGGYQGRHDRPVLIFPEQQAQLITDRMDSLLDLTEKQHKKLYKLYLKEARRQMESILTTSRPPMNNQPGGGSGGHPGGGNTPRHGGMRHGGHGGHPHGGFGQTPPMQRPDVSDDVKAMETQRNKEEKQREKMEKKIRKILTEEQYARLQEERMRLMPEPERERAGMLLPDMKLLDLSPWDSLSGE